MQTKQTVSITFTLDIPKEVLSKQRINEHGFAGYARRLIALDLYTAKNISLGFCAEVAEMPKEAFIRFLGENNVSIFNHNDINDFIEETQNA